MANLNRQAAALARWPQEQLRTIVFVKRPGADPSAAWQSCETVGTPLFAADPVMNEEQPGGIIFLLHFCKFRIVRTPKRRLPSVVKEISLRDIGSSDRCDRTQLICGGGNGNCRLATGCEVRLMAQQTRRCVWITSRDERKRKCIKDRRISGCVTGRGDPLFGRAGKPLVEMQLDLEMPCARK